MAEQFRAAGLAAASVYAGSELSRGEALQQLAANRLQVIFSVDLFNEGVDLPAIDTVVAQLEAHGMVTLGEQREITPAVSRRILEAAL